TRAVAELVRRHELAVVLHEGPPDVDAVAALVGRVDALVLKQPSLPRLAGALCHAAAWLGDASGVTHLAPAAGRPPPPLLRPAGGCGAPPAALFGAERVAWRPWSTTAQVVVVESGRLKEEVSAITSTLDGLLSS